MMMLFVDSVCVGGENLGRKWSWQVNWINIWDSKNQLSFIDDHCILNTWKMKWNIWTKIKLTCSANIKHRTHTNIAWTVVFYV